MSQNRYMHNKIAEKDAVIAGLRQRARELEYQLEILDSDDILYEEEIDRLNNVITEQAAEIRGLQEEASDYRNEIAGLQEEVKNLRAFMCMGEGI